MAKQNITKTTNIDASVRVIDFVNRFGMRFQALMDILGISRPIEKENGTRLRRLIASVDLENSVAEGEEIPYSLAQVAEELVEDVTIEKYSKGTTGESISKYGYDVAIGKTDDALLVKLVNVVTSKFYAGLNAGGLYSVKTDWQSAVAYAKGFVVDKFMSLDLDYTEVVGFANILDATEYLAKANITTQTQYGIDYVENFMGYKTLFLLPDKYIKRGRVIATPVENLNAYYVNPANTEFAKAGLVFTTDNVTNLVGVWQQGDYNTFSSEIFAILGLTLFAELIDGIAVVDIESAGSSIGTLTVTSAEGTAVGNTALTVTGEKINPADRYFISSSTKTFLADVSKETKWDGVSEVSGLTDGSTYYLIEADSTGQALAQGSFTADVKNS